MNQFPARGTQIGEKVVGEGEILQLGQLADRLGDRPVEQVACKVELLDALQAAEGQGDGAGDAVLPGIEKSSFP